MARSAVSLVLLVCAVAAALLPTGQAHSLIGGSSTIKDYVLSLIAAYDKLPSADWHGPYTGSNSKSGISKFISQTYLIAVTTRPFSTSEDAQYSKKYTIPFGMMTVSPFSSSTTGSRFTLNAGQVANILKGKITMWSQLPGSGLTGAITVVARSDESGTTALVNTFLRAAVGTTNWPFSGEGPHNFGSARAIYVSTAALVASTLKTIPGSFGFLQSGHGMANGLKEVLLKNRNGKAVGITKSPVGNVALAITQSPPSFTGSWRAVTTVWKGGDKTYPIAGFVYMMFRTQYSKAQYSAVVKAFGVYVLSSAGQNIGTSQKIFSLPATKYRIPATNIIKAIKEV